MASITSDSLYYSSGDELQSLEPIDKFQELESDTIYRYSKRSPNFTKTTETETEKITGKIALYVFASFDHLGSISFKQCSYEINSLRDSHETVFVQRVNSHQDIFSALEKIKKQFSKIVNTLAITSHGKSDRMKFSDDEKGELILDEINENESLSKELESGFDLIAEDGEIILKSCEVGQQIAEKIHQLTKGRTVYCSPYLCARFQIIDGSEVEMNERRSVSEAFEWKKALSYSKEENIISRLEDSLKFEFPVSTEHPTSLKAIDRYMREAEHYFEEFKKYQEGFFERTFLDSDKQIRELFSGLELRLKERSDELNQTRKTLEQSSV